MDKKYTYIAIIVFVSIILYFNVLSSNKPLGLDTLGNLSKVSYFKEFGFVKWDMVWYNGAPFLKFYSPLYYILASFFENVFFASNFLCFFSIFLTSVGIFLLVSHITKKRNYGFISGLLFLSVLNISYYYISTGNQPFVFAVFTIPFSLLFLEKSLDNKRYFILYSLFLVMAIYSHIFVGLCVIFISGFRCLTYYGYSFKNIKKGFLFSLIILVPAILLSCFWLLSFLTNFSSYAGDNAGYIPLPYHLFGFGNYMIWGAGAGEIGIAFALFLVCSFLLFYKKIKMNYAVFLFVLSIIFFLLLEGILGQYYPNGIGAIRFILPFSVIICIFVGVVLSNLNIKKSIFVLLFFTILIGLYFSYNMIQLNYNNYSYGDDGSRYYFIKEISKNNSFPLKNEFNNYRFGTTRYVFSETMNFIFPRKSQTYGYHDQGILFPNVVNLMKEKIWQSDEINSTVYFLDWFGIDYFEMGGQDLNFSNKFENSGFFNKKMDTQIADYRFKLFEYKNKKPIISYLKTHVASYPFIKIGMIGEMASRNIGIEEEIPIETFDNISIYENYLELNFTYKRDNPDRVIISFDYNKNGVVLLKEFYHDSWSAKDINSNKELKIYKTGQGFMLVIPSHNSKGIIFYQKDSLIDYLGILFSILGIILLILIVRADLLRKFTSY